MIFEEVYNLFMVYSGLSGADASRYSFFSTNAINYLQGELINPEKEEENGWQLNVAASALAYYNYCLAMNASGGVSSFKAGDITVNNSNNLESAKEMWMLERAKIATLIKDNSFSFKKV